MSLTKQRTHRITVALVLAACAGCGRAEVERLSAELAQQKAEHAKTRIELDQARAEVERLSAGGPDGIDETGVLTQSGDFTSARFVEADKARGGVGGVYEITFPRSYPMSPSVTFSRKMAPGATFEVERLEATTSGFRYSSVTTPSDPAAQVTRWRARGMVK